MSTRHVGNHTERKKLKKVILGILGLIPLTVILVLTMSLTYKLFFLRKNVNYEDLLGIYLLDFSENILVLNILKNPFTIFFIFIALLINISFLIKNFLK